MRYRLRLNKMNNNISQNERKQLINIGVTKIIKDKKRPIIIVETQSPTFLEDVKGLSFVKNVTLEFEPTNNDKNSKLEMLKVPFRIHNNNIKQPERSDVSLSQNISR